MARGLTPAQTLYAVNASANRAKEILASMRWHATKAGVAIRTIRQSKNTLVGNAQQAIAARDAFTERVSAEGRRYQAAFMLMSLDRRKRAHDLTLQAQSKVVGAPVLFEEAEHATREAEILELAAEHAFEAVKEVPIPDVVSARRAMQAKLQAQRSSKETTLSLMPGWQPPAQFVSPLVADFYPPEVVRAAGSLKGLGDVTPPKDDFVTSVLAALGMGAAAAGSAALAAGKEIASRDPAAGAAIGAGGGILSSLASALGLSQSQGERGASLPMTTRQEKPHEWPFYLGIAAATGLGVFVLMKVIK